MGAAIIPIISAVGGVFSNRAKAEQADRDRKQTARERADQLAEEQRQFNQSQAQNQQQFSSNYGLNASKANVDAQSAYGDRAQSVNRELEVLPARDQAMALLKQRMSAQPQQVQQRSLMGGQGTDSLRGSPTPQMPFDLNAMRDKAAAYKPGDGGMTGNVQTELLKRYMDVPKAPDMVAPPPATTASKGVDPHQALWDADYANVMGDKNMPADFRDKFLAGLRSEYIKKYGYDPMNPPK